jgi:putative glutamine amidotransferase
VEVVRLSAGDDNLSEVGRLDGLVLSGGVDIHPSLYGGSMEYEKGPKDGWQLERDEFEKAALKKAWSLGLPVFGVCRGLQLINVCTGGTLVQDLGSIGDEVHQNKGVIDMEHGVFIEKNSLLGSIALKGGTINSAHHQSIDELGEGLRVNCVAEDGTIEGIEWAEPVGKPFMLAVQWHPERMFTNGFEDVWLYRDLRDRFIMEIRKNKGL